MRVLMIDDEPSHIQHHIRALEAAGAQVTVAHTNESAVQIIEATEGFDIIVQDIARPSGSVLSRDDTRQGTRTGLVFLERYIRPKFPCTPHVFFSHAAGITDIKERYQEDPTCFFLSKSDLLPQEFTTFISGLVKRDLDLLYTHTPEQPSAAETYPLVVSVGTEIKKHLSRHPEQLYNLSPRAFEELVAEVLSDLGLRVDLTKSTRDGGVDIYAYLRHSVGNFLMLVECKKCSPTNHVGIDVVQRLYGIQQTKKASKALIVTTSFFTDPAKKEAALHNGLMDLSDFCTLKQWLAKYR